MVDYFNTLEIGSYCEVFPDLYRIRLPLPFALNHVNVWALRGDDGWSLIDYGLAKKDSLSLWDEFLTQTVKDDPVEKLIATHFHPDHVGAAGHMHLKYPDADFYMSQTEWLFARMLSLDGDDIFKERTYRFYHEAGIDEALCQELIYQGNVYKTRVTPIPTPYNRLQAGDKIKLGNLVWEVIIGTGHAPEHVSLYNDQERILIAGDQILPKITPNISVWPHEPLCNNLDGYLTSIQQFYRLPSDTKVLPSHGDPFTGLHARVTELEDHHQERLSKTIEICHHHNPCKAIDVVNGLFRKGLDQHQMFFAVGEAYSHLNYLIGQNKMRRMRDHNRILLYFNNE